MSKAIQVFIDGAEGTTGLRLADRLATRPEIRLLSIDPGLRKDPEEKARVSNSADVVFLCLPDDPAREAVRRISPEVKVIDASTAHRVAEGWTYGLPELSPSHREAVAGSKRTSVPGCHAMGFAILCHPLVQEGIIPADYPVTCHSVTGYSGAGKPMIAKYADPDRHPSYASPRQYALGQVHKHLPEMAKASGLEYPPVFNPIIADFYAGMVVTIPLHTRLMQKCRTPEELHALYAQRYAGQKLVRVMPLGAEAREPNGMLDATSLAGLDYAQIFLCGNEDRMILCARFDNLGKGASGAAIQCMNLMCGLDETAGLDLGAPPQTPPGEGTLVP